MPARRAIQNQLSQLREFAATQGWTIVRENVEAASGKTGDRQQFIALFSMHPVEDNERVWYCEAEGSWNLLSTDKKSPHEESKAQDSTEGLLRMVAGAGFEPATFGL
jgi:hypothetical protein